MAPSDIRPRFIAPMPRLGGNARDWRDQLLRIEELGFDEVAISEHYSQGWAMEPLSALAFAAASTTRLRFLTLVLNNDLHHPAMLAKAFATSDVLSGGRVTLGLGAGWSPADYRALGIEFEPPAERIDRLSESLRVIRAFFEGDTVDFVGEHYRLEQLEALPPTVQPSGPPLLVGAGGPRMLELAGRQADIVGVHVTMGPRGFDERAAREMSAPAIAEKIARVRQAAHSVGRRMPLLQFTPVIVVADGRRSTPSRRGFTDYIETHPEQFEDTPAVLVGSAGQIAESVERWSADLGIGLWHLGGEVETIGRIVTEVNR